MTADGTSMAELEPVISKLFERYGLLGFVRPQSVYTDRCCQERELWRRILHFPELHAVVDEHVHEDDLERVTFADMPYETRPTAINQDMGLVYLGEISDYLNSQAPADKSIIIDCEWKVGSAVPDTASIFCTNADAAPYSFSLWKIKQTQSSRFASQFKLLLEDPLVKKIGNRICADVTQLRGIGIEMAPTVELGHLARERSVAPTQSPSLVLMIATLYPGVKLSGKDGYPRIGPWNSWPLPDEMERYMNNDAYIEAICYKRLMQLVIPSSLPRLRVEDLREGLSVNLYSSQFKSRVAKGTLTGGRSRSGQKAHVKVSLAEANVFVVNHIVEVVSSNVHWDADDSSLPSFASLLARAEESDVLEPHVVLAWSLYFCRQPVEEEAEAISLNTIEREAIIQREEVEDDELDSEFINDDSADEEEWEDIHPSPSSTRDDLEDGGEDDDTDESMQDSSDAGEPQEPRRQSRRVRRRLYRVRLRSARFRRYKLREERVKNDIARIFFRFERVLRKDHGANQLFHRALRDAIYILNQDDLNACIDVLRSVFHMSDEDIRYKRLTDFRWFKMRVRRFVPGPIELERRYMSVIEEFKDIVDAKTGFPFFSDAAKAVHRSVLGHIRKNCISDIPFVR